MGNGFEPAVFSAEAAARPTVMLKVPLTSLARLRSGARWFYWVAGLSLVNTAAAFAGGHVHFMVGLGITQVVDAVAHRAGAAATLPALVIDVMIAVHAWRSDCGRALTSSSRSELACCCTRPTARCSYWRTIG